MQKLHFRITSISKHPGEVVTFSLEPLSERKPDFISGQFLSIILQTANKELRRSYSICSSPYTNEPITIAVKRIENGEVSRKLFNDTREGDVLTTLEPNGIFTYEPIKNSKRTIFLFAAGVGITPLISMLKTILTAEDQSKVVLVYSNRSQASTLFFYELNKWQSNYSNRFDLIYLFSESQNLIRARLNKILIQEIISEHLIFEKSDALFYTCGPISYMDVCRLTLLGMGFGQWQIKRETFFISADDGDEDDETENIPTDTNTYTVRIIYQNRKTDVDIPYHKSILDIALENKIDMPYSCRSGICGTCTAFCSQGNIRMDYNEVLTENDIEKGKILTCVGHPTVNGTEIWI
ncbi:phenylacetic acid degradation protein [Solitalea longa]|uniref:Phenylacetic acid degradation protein n=1 Tax=Solitalea longa TaxID=2079460 RepID=A0A2S5A4I6_9SPHI|nr:ferredoxin--NADP reductase [Solitalea longa]POY37444.1 phenylacetic acid degradation protein [Solitalea longa]